MSIISIVAALDEAQGLGRNNQLLCHLPADLQYFKATTLGKPIIMGRKTYESIGKPLPGRTNIVISNTQTKIAGVEIYNSIEKALSAHSSEPELMIIGGAQLYKNTINIVNRLYITKIHHRFDADVFFPPIDSTIWICKKEAFRKRDEKNSYDMTFQVYEKRDVGE